MAASAASDSLPSSVGSDIDGGVDIGALDGRA